MKLSTLVKPELIKSDCVSENLEELFSEIVEVLASTDYIKDKTLVCSKLIEREKLGSTSIGNNAAIPHAKIKGLEETVVFIALSRNGISFNSDNKNEMVNLIILILSPINSPVSHLQTLAAAASMIKNCPDFIKETSSLSPSRTLDYLKNEETKYDK